MIRSVKIGFKSGESTPTVKVAGYAYVALGKWLNTGKTKTFVIRASSDGAVLEYTLTRGAVEYVIAVVED